MHSIYLHTLAYAVLASGLTVSILSVYDTFKVRP